MFTHELPPGAPGRFYYPARYGYIGLTCVTARSRGYGVGRALTAHALAEFERLDYPVVMLHFIDDNELSRRLWDRAGLAPHVVTLSGDVLA